MNTPLAGVFLAFAVLVFLLLIARTIYRCFTNRNCCCGSCNRQEQKRSKKRNNGDVFLDVQPVVPEQHNVATPHYLRRYNSVLEKPVYQYIQGPNIKDPYTGDSFDISETKQSSVLECFHKVYVHDSVDLEPVDDEYGYDEPDNAAQKPNSESQQSGNIKEHNRNETHGNTATITPPNHESEPKQELPVSESQPSVMTPPSASSEPDELDTSTSFKKHKYATVITPPKYESEPKQELPVSEPQPSGMILLSASPQPDKLDTSANFKEHEYATVITPPKYELPDSEVETNQELNTTEASSVSINHTDVLINNDERSENDATAIENPCMEIDMFTV